MNEFIVLVTILLNIITTATSNSEVLGCGGFLKSHVPIDFTKVEVKITKQGIVKDKTTAAPNTGYYFVPLYDKGEMILEVSPPPGWSFEPKSIPLFVDGESDLCSLGKDINFVFQGFGITGKVDSLGSNPNGPGPEGVSVTLESDDGEIRTTISDKEGNFFFTPVYPRKYKVSISHPKWKILQKTIEVTVAEGNTDLPKNSLIVEGYDVSGLIKSEGQSVRDTVVVLLSKEKPVHSISGCDKIHLEGFTSQDNVLCQTKTRDNGQFIFNTVPNGNYYVIPYYKNKNIYFKPEKIEFVVNNNDLELEESFEIIGFSISGKVLKAEGAPLPNAKVFLNGKEFTKTNSKGIYTLEKIKAGSYSIKAEADNMQFEEVYVTVGPSLSELPDLLPSAFKVCGTVASDSPQTITFYKLASTTFIQAESSPKNGRFCQFVPPGKYEVGVVVSDANRKKGLQFYPTTLNIEVSARKAGKIAFSQLKSTIHGKVQCLVSRECEGLSVVLKSGKEREFTVKIKGGAYSVSDVYPGTYEVSVVSNKFCWESNKQTVIVDKEKVEVPRFFQKGYTVVFVSSHDTKVTFKTSEQTTQTIFDVPKGRSSFCLEKSGDYLFNLISCHSYPQKSIVHNTNAEINEIILTAQKHTLILGIEADVDFGPIQVAVKIGTDKTERKLTYNNGIYELDIILESGESAVIVPQSDVLYFNPPILSVEGENDCTNLGVKFVAVKGKLFEGKVIPPLAGVTITVESTDSEQLVLDTDDNGIYKFQPLDPKQEYKITAVKDSYVLSGPDNNGNILAHKLAEVIVEVVDSSNRPLSGVLLSLSGGESYRKNLQSVDDGKISFGSLSPSEYFLRPMMKEYQFDPNSKIIPVQEGETVKVRLLGKRVAYSAFGQIVSLNGEPEIDMVVVAEGIGNCSDYSEETTCELSGQFRIRGLQPYCDYNVFVKKDLQYNKVIERSAPEYVSLENIKEDVRDIRLITFRPPLQTVILVKVYADNPDHYKSLRVKLVRESSPTAVVYSAKLDSVAVKISKLPNSGVLLYLPSIPLDSTLYTVQLESTLPGTKQQIIYFNAIKSFKYVEFLFNLKDNVSDQRIKQISLWNLVFIFVILLAANNVEWIANILREKFNFNVSHLSQYIPSTSSNQKSSTDYYDDAQIDQIVQSINSTKKKPRPKKA